MTKSKSPPSRPAKASRAPKKKTSVPPAEEKAPATAKKAPAERARAKVTTARAKLDSPVEAWFDEQPEPHRAILDALRELVVEAAPEATASIKWGMPFFAVGTAMMCGLTSHKAHVNLVLSGPAEAYPDPDGRLLGDGKTGRHLRLQKLDDLPREAVRAWLRAAAALAQSKAGKSGKAGKAGKAGKETEPSYSQLRESSARPCLGAKIFLE